VENSSLLGAQPKGRRDVVGRATERAISPVDVDETHDRIDDPSIAADVPSSRILPCEAGPLRRTFGP